MSDAKRRFYPQRLTLARELRGITKTELAERIQKTAGAISHFEGGRSQLILEVGGRSRFGDGGDYGLLGGLRVQRAFGQRTFLRLDAYGGRRGDTGPVYGGRSEIVLKF